MTSILIGVDDSPRSEDAVAFAGTVATASSATVVLACAFPYDDTPSRVSNREFRAALAAQADETLSRAAARLEGVDPARVKTVAVPSTSAPRALDRRAESQRAELIVVGATHTGHLGRIFPGSTTERLLHGAPCPVAVVPGVAGQPAPIAVAYDGSEESVAAVNAATRFARALSGQLRVIGVFEAAAVAGPVATAGAGLEMREAAAKQARARLDRATAELPEDVHAQAVFLAGDAVRQLRRPVHRPRPAGRRLPRLRPAGRRPARRPHRTSVTRDVLPTDHRPTRPRDAVRRPFGPAAALTSQATAAISVPAKARAAVAATRRSAAARRSTPARRPRPGRALPGLPDSVEVGDLGLRGAQRSAADHHVLHRGGVGPGSGSGAVEQRECPLEQAAVQIGGARSWSDHCRVTSTS